MPNSIKNELLITIQRDLDSIMTIVKNQFEQYGVVHVNHADELTSQLEIHFRDNAFVLDCKSTIEMFGTINQRDILKLLELGELAQNSNISVFSSKQAAEDFVYTLFHWGNVHHAMVKEVAGVFYVEVEVYSRDQYVLKSNPILEKVRIK